VRYGRGYGIPLMTLRMNGALSPEEATTEILRFAQDDTVSGGGSLDGELFGCGLVGGGLLGGGLLFGGLGLEDFLDGSQVS